MPFDTFSVSYIVYIFSCHLHPCRLFFLALVKQFLKGPHLQNKRAKIMAGDQKKIPPATNGTAGDGSPSSQLLAASHNSCTFDLQEGEGETPKQFLVGLNYC